MAKNKNKQSPSVVSQKMMKNMKKQKERSMISYKAGPSRVVESSAPVAASYRVVTGPPSITSSRDSTRVRHRELVVPSITGSAAFSVANYLQLNPGLAGVFPWLSTIAANWEQYRVHRLRAEYIPIAPTSTQGDVLLSPDYDASDPIPTSEQQAANNRDAVMDSCWRRIICEFNPASLMAGCTRKFVRQSAVAGDVKTFDVGRLAVCTNNSSGTPLFGKLFLEYDVEFFVPQSSPNVSTTSNGTSLFSNAANQSLTTGIRGNVSFPTTVFDPLYVGPAVAGVFTPPAGCYEVTAIASCSDTSAEQLTFSLEIYKNGAALANRTIGFAAGNAGAGEEFQVVTKAIVPCNGSDTISVSAYAVGAAGTLVIPGATSSLTWRLA